ncbi:alpha-amylase family glycosyl hydrolase [Bifidobacterium callimiconis]|uniref:alpha-amylase family glycosyl hydrolase n=1 Tax=Bifidobacterium callimiconis TaxID=2306973 RepID=UPI001F0AD0EA|nr:alpha-amylase family glycosyl hydrolase [Bifidobacterium callimiconis]
MGVLPVDELPVYAGDDLGAIPDRSGLGTTFRVWAPTAANVELRLFYEGGACASGVYAEGPASDADASDRPYATYAMNRNTAAFHTSGAASHPDDGTWTIHVDDVGHGTYYDYMVHFPNGRATRTADPWARAAGANGRRSMVVDLRKTDPDGWAVDHSPNTPMSELVVWETHVGDFSNDPHSGIPAEHRGTYLAFTHPDTSVDGEGEFPTCMAYLRRLGVTAVQLMPIFDFGSVDEAAARDGDPLRRAYNWGYDPVNYNVPEGSYSTDPFDGATRIRECKQMIQALHANGFKVIMDVVYNHMYSADNWLERMVPGYFCRRYAGGALSNGSGCGNDMASERPMMRKYIVDSVEYWAREYHIDGFRFDLMGLMDVDTMNAVRARLDSLPGGAGTIIYGEPWAADMTAVSPDVVLAGKRGLSQLNPRIGFFSDDTRDAIRGNIFHHHKPGYVSGAAREFAPAIRHAVDAWRGTQVEAASVGQFVQYVSAHDDLTLWDKLCMAMRSVAFGHTSTLHTDHFAGAGSSDSADSAGAANPADASSGSFDADARPSADSGLAGMNGLGMLGNVWSAADSGPTNAEYDADPSLTEDIMETNRMAAGIIATSAGVPFMLSGEEFARTKHGCDNSYDRSAELNRLDWRRARRLGDLVDYYAALIRLRRHNPAYFGGPRIVPARDDSVVVFRVGNDCVTVNPTRQTAWQTVSALRAVHDYGQFAPLDDSAWECVFSSRGPEACGEANWASYTKGHERQIAIPPRAFCVWRNG